MSFKSAVIASAVAGLFIAGAAHTASAEDAASGEKIKCEGVNSCKGTSDCKTAHNACAGQNGCGGHGFKMMTADECAAAKAKAAEKKS
jgi:hypothetical protein